jgi:putative methionine-R-sulfoxide reductase with GAF domain
VPKTPVPVRVDGELRGVLNLKSDALSEYGEGRLDLIQARVVVEVE